MSQFVFLILHLWAGPQLRAQRDPSIAAFGYEYSMPLMPLAPGQLLTLFVSGIPAEVGSARAPEDVDLPVQLLGISARAGQFQSPAAQTTVIASWDVPILEVRSRANCFSLFGQCFQGLSGITVQIPFELQADDERPCSDCRPAGAPSFSIRVNGASTTTYAEAYRDQVHILRAFDSVLPMPPLPTRVGPCNSPPGRGFYSPANISGGYPCPPIVKHSDGSLVTETNPARPGEELLALAVGLGRTEPASITGRPVVTSAATVTTFVIDFNYRPNALGTKPPHVDSPDVERPLYTGSAVGAVGQYEIRFRVPPVPAGTRQCGDSGLTHIWSNLTVSIGGRDSFDGAGICVAVEDNHQ